MIKLSDYIIKFLEEKGVGHIFMFTGGMAMHLNESVGNAKHLKPVFMLHEQGCSFAAESYARITNNLGVTIVTCGPGATNTITGIACSWIESTPLLVISGQCKRDDISHDSMLRQFGVQEVKITDIVRPITKYTATIEDPQRIRYELEKSFHLCKSGRPGPVLLDIPVDVQACMIDEDNLESFNEHSSIAAIEPNILSKVVELIKKSKRPIIYAGAGISMAGARDSFRCLIEKLGIPVLLHWNSIDLIEEDHPLYAGRPGAVGQRAANFALQNADLLISIGTRLALLQTGYNFEGFAKNATHVMVDIDPAELDKKNIHPDLKICADAGDFIKGLNDIPNLHNKNCQEWISQISSWRKKYPAVKDEWRHTPDYVNSYCLMEAISSEMNADDIFVGGRAGTCVDAAIQAFKVKKDQRAYVTKGLSSMGNGLPAAIGGAYATGKKIISVIGDGGFVMNAQELEVIRRDNLPVKIFVLDNNGYSTIRNTQTRVFDGHLVGCSPESGLTCGNISQLASAYDIKVFSMHNAEEMNDIVRKALSFQGPCVVNVKVAPDQSIEPRQSSFKTEDGFMKSRPLEDMAPLLPPEELSEIMSVSQLDVNCGKN